MVPTLTIGSLALQNNLLLAPMAGITNLPMRLLARECGASLCFTEMISANGLVRDGRKTFQLLRSLPADRPLGIQLFGDDPELLAEAAKLVEGYGDLIDINMGCPVKKVVGAGAGSALLRDPRKAGAIIGAVRRSTKLPLTIKIRSGWHREERVFREIARIAEVEGCDAITLHPRSRTQMFDGRADWQDIKELKVSVSIPVIGSGDLFEARDIIAMLESTGCDGVMIARGGLGNPWIFRQALALMTDTESEPPAADERVQVSLKHLQLFLELAGERVAIGEMRKHLAWYAKGLPGAAQYRDLVNRVTGIEELTGAVHGFFSGISQ